jgi:hypothetical protein
MAMRAVVNGEVAGGGGGIEIGLYCAAGIFLLLLDLLEPNSTVGAHATPCTGSGPRVAVEREGRGRSAIEISPCLRDEFLTLSRRLPPATERRQRSSERPPRC